MKVKHRHCLLSKPDEEKEIKVKRVHAESGLLQSSAGNHDELKKSGTQFHGNSPK